MLYVALLLLFELATVTLPLLILPLSRTQS